MNMQQWQNDNDRGMPKYSEKHLGQTQVLTFFENLLSTYSTLTMEATESFETKPRRMAHNRNRQVPPCTLQHYQQHQQARVMLMQQESKTKSTDR